MLSKNFLAKSISIRETRDLAPTREWKRSSVEPKTRQREMWNWRKSVGGRVNSSCNFIRDRLSAKKTPGGEAGR
jgi:hypothetical protein